MSVSVFVLSLALTGQVAGDDRYGSPSSAAPSAVSPPPMSGSTRERVSPPPAFTPQPPTSPAMTSGDYGYNAPAARATRPSAPPATTPIDSPNSTTGISTTGIKPSAMMRTMLVVPDGSRLTGQPTRLSEVLIGASTRLEQSQRIEAYWDLSSSVADYHLGIHEQDELQRLRSSASNVGPVWQQAASELGLRIGTSERAAKASQYRLASLMGRAGAASLPLPTDMPHCGDYYARYDQVFAGRPSAEAQELSELLTMRYQELSDAAQGVQRAEQFLGDVAAKSGTGDGSGTLRALELLALRRRAFVQIARDYNRRIARYTELASPGQIDTDRLIGMLIMRQGAANTATRPNSLVPPPNRQSQLPLEKFDPADREVAESDQTFAEGWESIKSAAAEVPRDEAVRPASAEAKRSKPRREHSLLVPSE